MISKVIPALIVFGLLLWLISMAYKLGKAKRKKVTKVAPDLDTKTEITDRIKAVQLEIDLINKRLPDDIEKRKEQLIKLQDELEELQKLKTKFEK